jgi:hypothetical protein
LNSFVETPNFLFFATSVAVTVRLVSTAADSHCEFLAFKYLPTPPLAVPESVLPVTGWLYHDPILS